VHVFDFLPPDSQIARRPVLGDVDTAFHKPYKVNLNRHTHLLFLHDAYHFSISRFNTCNGQIKTDAGGVLVMKVNWVIAKE